jgi:hypothetical protein
MSKSDFDRTVMNWISEATSLLYDSFRSDSGRKIMSDACQQCWEAIEDDDSDREPAAWIVALRDDDHIYNVYMTDGEAEAICRWLGEEYEVSPVYRDRE